MIFETDAEDIIKDKNYIKILTSIEDFESVEKILEEKNIDLLESKLDFVPDSDIVIEDFDKALKFKKMIEAFNEDEDVSLVSSNEIISEELDKKVEEFIEKNTFKT
jgi:transcriptional/translational regulatory protein YebC/TACO1